MNSVDLTVRVMTFSLLSGLREKVDPDEHSQENRNLLLMKT